MANSITHNDILSAFSKNKYIIIYYLDGIIRGSNIIAKRIHVDSQYNKLYHIDMCCSYSDFDRNKDRIMGNVPGPFLGSNNACVFDSDGKKIFMRIDVVSINYNNEHILTKVIEFTAIVGSEDIDEFCKEYNGSSVKKIKKHQSVKSRWEILDLRSKDE